MRRSEKPSPGIAEIDIHGMNKYQAKVFIESKLKTVSKSTYKLRIIHGFHRGTELRDMVRKELRANKKVIRIEVGLNPGETDIVLRELF